ncbi:MAG: glutaminyl-peptide cyclotransferase [Akkermansiaceae bacterium]
MHHLKAPLLLVLSLLALSSCGKFPPAKLTYQVVSTRPHDPAAYTQGLQLAGGRLFESTGQYGESTLREIEPATGKILRKRPLAKNVFGEGLTLLNRELFVLTWKENTAYVFDPETFKLLRSHNYQGEGWGLTDNGKQLIMSDGSSELKFIDPKNFATLKTLTVLDGNAPVKNLNELEWINGEIFANIYQSEKIARISPDDGRVTGWLDLAGLRQQLTRPNRAEVLNGIAFDPATGHLLVTGKYWPQMFEIKITEK